MTARPSNDFARYHAHVYFDESTLTRAVGVCEQAASLFSVKVGRFHRRPIGPHPRWSCQIAFGSAQFGELIPWLDNQRGPLTVFVHPDTGDDLADHSTYAAWLGEAVPLNLAMFGG